jgi:hypothetical protein
MVNINCVIYSSPLYAITNGALIVIFSSALDLSQHNKEFRRDAEGHEQVDDDIRGKQLQEGLSPDHELSIANIVEEADDHEGSEMTLANMRSVLPVSPVPNICARPDDVQDSSGSEGLTLMSQPPPELPAQPEAQDPPVSSRPSRRSIPPPPAPVDEGTQKHTSATVSCRLIPKKKWLLRRYLTRYKKL